VSLLGLSGYVDPSIMEPLVKGVEPYDVVFCVLHALARVSDLVVDWLHDWVMNQGDHKILLVKVLRFQLCKSSGHAFSFSC
jgi:hypothetical protein